MTARPPSVSPRRPGRPRDDRADEAILDAAVAVLADRGPAGFTVDAVAAKAGCGKATIYRRWASRSRLLLEAANRLGLEPSPIDTGDIRDDLVQLMTELSTKMRSTEPGRILPAVIAEASVQPEMAAVLAGFVDDRRVRPREIVRRAVDRGQLPADADVEMMLDVLAGTVMYRELIARSPCDDAFIAGLVDRVLLAFRSDGA